MPLLRIVSAPEDPGLRSRCAAGGAVFLPEDAQKITIGPSGAYHILLLPVPGRDNLAMLEEIRRAAAAAGNPDVSATAFIPNDALRFGSYVFPELDTQLVSYEQLAAEDFLDRHPPLERLLADGNAACEDGVLLPRRKFSLCVIGGGPLAREFLLQVYENTAFETAGTKAYAAEFSVLGNTETLLRQVPRLAEDGLVHTLADEDDIRPGAYEMIFIDTGSTAENLALARRLRQRDTGAEIVPVICGSDASRTDVSGLTPMYPDSVYDRCGDLMERTQLREYDRLSRLYMGGPLLDARWPEIGSFERQSKCAAVRDLTIKRMLTAPERPADEERFLWRLSEYEHRRWCSFCFSRGWQDMPAAELTEAERAAFVTKHTDSKRHICLVPWEELDSLPQKEPGYIRWLDYCNVAGLFGKKF